jgi:hypothetical protein
MHVELKEDFTGESTVNTYIAGVMVVRSGVCAIARDRVSSKMTQIRRFCLDLAANWIKHEFGVVLHPECGLVYVECLFERGASVWLPSS